MIAWDDRAELYGIDSRIVFFEPDTPATLAEPKVERRALRFMNTDGVRAISVESDRHLLRFGGIVAQLDGLFTYKNGLIALEFKTRTERLLSRTGWRREVRLKDMLQCTMAAYVAAQLHRKLVANLLRYRNAALMLTPRPEVVEAVLELVPMATAYHQESRDVAVSKLAEFAASRIESRFGDRAQRNDVAGQKAHEELLRRSD
ncbi:MAG TPA: hypothetical protein VHU40_09785 [Polyangia bacterium]|nr:hypothetical protein [Polyangia bacterium]